MSSWNIYCTIDEFYEIGWSLLSTISELFKIDEYFENIFILYQNLYPGRLVVGKVGALPNKVYGFSLF